MSNTRFTLFFTNIFQLLDSKIQTYSINFPIKILLLLLGFFIATVLATVFGQTGDWDVLVAGILVAMIEILGNKMYSKKDISTKQVFNISFLSLIGINYIKIGLIFGLFVDAFKLGS